MSKALVTAIIRQGMTEVLNREIQAILKEEAERAAREVTRRIVALSSTAFAKIATDSADYMMDNRVQIHFHLPAAVE